MKFTTKVEQRASEASTLEAFASVSLYGIKDGVAKLLELIGKNGIFDEYTRHDISHINKLLEMMEWIIPPATFSKLTIADCLMLTLAVYFHDLGMVVTRDEYARRHESSFPEFKKTVFDGDSGKDYRVKVDRMPENEAERFLYQEFVRQNHAERIRLWVSGKSQKDLGVTDRVVAEVDQLLKGLDARFRRDLGLVCESHHREDLGNLEKYKVSQPYGSGPQESVNLQYCAILLRTADLLHVTRDRTPSISFRAINPSDPKSIEEWRKQMPLVSVRPKPGVNSEGNVDTTVPMDTVEVSGLFTEPQGFFALTAYLGYARKELRTSSDWAQTAKKKKNSLYEFPWRDIDESGLEAEGFIDKQFEFTLDQARILDLLTGQTLYNDTTVVLRELIQNSLDAIRVQWENEAEFIDEGDVTVTWDRASRLLSVRDNGTGMTQKIIDAHFLKVGSSLYQDQEFRRAHPSFSAISRFGIGVLSAFMISDEIEVTTCHPEDPEARTLSLRSLHGKYLIRLIDKTPSELSPQEILPHGTNISLRVRPSAELEDLPAILRRWIVIPRCKVSVIVDGEPPEQVGFLQPKDALRSELISQGLKVIEDNDSTPPKDRAHRIEQRSKDGVTLAYALQWSTAFQEWTFSPTFAPRDRVEPPLIGSCVEGIRVDFASPGFQDSSILSLANAVGPNAPRTNVARSGLEKTSERDTLLDTIYELYCDHVKTEVEKLQTERGFSLTWALVEATYLLNDLLPNNQRPARAIDLDALLRACGKVPSIALEDGGSRVGVTPTKLSEYESFWTVDSGFFTSAETLLREIPTSVAISTLAEAIGAESLRLPAGPYISVQRFRSLAQRMAFQRREVNRIVLYPDQRRIDLRWVDVADPPRWRNALPVNPDARRGLQQALGHLGPQFQIDLAEVRIAQSEIDIVGNENEQSVGSLGRTFVMPGTKFARYLLDLLDQIDAEPTSAKLAMYAIALQLVGHRGAILGAADFVRQQLAFMGRTSPLGMLEVREDPELVAILQTTIFESFNPQFWTRGAPGPM